MTEIFNQQRKVKLRTADFKGFAQKAVNNVANGRYASIALVSDARMKALNKEFRGKDQTTDVLSFPFEDEFANEPDFLGDIVISAEQAQKQASENGLNFESEVKQLILHGILHLCGHDHETDNGEMNKLELEFREKLGI